MKHSIIVLGVAFAIVIALGSVFLAPDDLKQCGAQPSVADPHCAKADAIVAISGGATLERTKEAAELYRAGWADQLIVSGAALDGKGPSNAKVMRDEAIRLGVPEAAITIDESARTTRENAQGTSHEIDQTRVRRLIVVTSPYHQRRASIEFTRANPGVQIINHPVQDDPDWPALWWLTPKGWWLAGGELVKICIVWLGGGR